LREACCAAVSAENGKWVPAALSAALQRGSRVASGVTEIFSRCHYAPYTPSRPYLNRKSPRRHCWPDQLERMRNASSAKVSALACRLLNLRNGEGNGPRLRRIPLRDSAARIGFAVMRRRPFAMTVRSSGFNDFRSIDSIVSRYGRSARCTSSMETENLSWPKDANLFARSRSNRFRYRIFRE
jgi:hypothetical protein